MLQAGLRIQEELTIHDSFIIFFADRAFPDREHAIVVIPWLDQRLLTIGKSPRACLIPILVNNFQRSKFCGKLTGFVRVVLEINRGMKCFLHLSPLIKSTVHWQLAFCDASPRGSPGQRKPLENRSRIPTVSPSRAA